MALTRIQPSGINSTANFTFAGVTVTGVSNLGSNGNVVITGGSNGQALTTDGAGNLSWTTIVGGGGANISNGNSNVNIPAANGNVTISAVGNANVLVITGTGVNVAGTLNATGNALVGNLETTSVTATTLSGSLTTASQPNITSIGTLSSLAVTGNITAGNILAPLANGNSNVSIPAANGNILFSATGNSNIASISGVGISVGSGSLTRTNVAANTALFAVSNVSSDAPPIIIQNRFATGYTSMDFVSSSNLFMGAVGAANPSATSVAALANSAYLYGAGNAAGVGVYATTGNVSISAASNANILVVTGTGVNVAGTLNATGNSILRNSLILSGTSNTTSFGQALTVRSNTGNNSSVMGIMNEVSNAYSSLLFFNNSGAEVGAIAFGNPTSVYYSNTMYIYSPNTTNGIVLSANIGSAPGNKNLWITNAGLVTVPGSTAATSTTTGAFQVTGGAGIGGNVYIGGLLSVTGNANVGNIGAAAGIFTTVAGSLTTAAQPNITSVGALGSLTVTGNITAGNANLGNNVTANFFTGNGIYLTGITSTGVANGNSNISIPAANGNITLSASGNANVLVVTGTGLNVAGTGNFTGNLTANTFIAGNGSGGNLTNANVISANTGNFSANLISGGNLSVSGNAVVSGNLTVDGNLVYVNVTDLSVEDPIIQLQTGPNGAAPTSNTGKDVGTALNYYDSSAKVAWMGWDTSNAEIAFGANVGISSEVVTFTSLANIRAGNAALGNLVAANFVAGTLTTASQPNITSLGTLSSLTVSGTSNLGAVGNVIITGGNANYVLSTDGAGNLTWVAQTGGGGSPLVSVSDIFTGNGVQTTFTLSTTPSNINLTTVSYNGELLLRNSYSISGANIIFSEAPADGSEIEVTILQGSVGGSSIATASGSNTHVQFNDSGNFAGNAALTFDKTTTTLSANNLSVPGTVRSSLIPDANVTYDLGTSSMRWRDLYLSGNTIHLGQTQISTSNNTVVLPAGTQIGNVPVSVELSSMNDVDPNIAPEVFTINVDSPNAGHGDDWLWTWDAGTVAYSRSKVTNAVQATVPLYRSGTYVVNNFAAHDLHGNMTQTHKIYLKWVNGAGLDNLVSWAPSTLNVANVSHPDINGGANTTVQRLNINVPQTITIPPLNPPNVSYNVTVANMQWVFTGTAVGHNPNIGPVYRGGTYTFNLSNTAGHPFYLTTDNGDNFAGGQYVGEYTNGVTGSRNTSGNLTITIPNNAPNTLYYQCGNHGSMRGQIDVRNLEVETNASGNLILYFQHTQEGHFTPAEIRPTPNLQTISSACLIYNGANGKFEIKDLGQYLDETAQFQHKIETIVATGTADKPTNAEVVQKIKEETVFTTTMYQRGNLELTTGTMRWFAPYDLQITNITPRLGTAADANVSVMVKKNGANAQGFTFAASTTLANVANGNISMNTGDFLTVDVTNVGNALPGQDLYVQFTYKKV